MYLFLLFHDSWLPMAYGFHGDHCCFCIILCVAQGMVESLCCSSIKTHDIILVMLILPSLLIVLLFWLSYRFESNPGSHILEICPEDKKGDSCLNYHLLFYRRTLKTSPYYVQTNRDLLLFQSYIVVNLCYLNDEGLT